MRGLVGRLSRAVKSSPRPGRLVSLSSKFWFGTSWAGVKELKPSYHNMDTIIPKPYCLPHIHKVKLPQYGDMVDNMVSELW